MSKSEQPNAIRQALAEYQVQVKLTEAILSSEAHISDQRNPDEEGNLQHKLTVPLSALAIASLLREHGESGHPIERVTSNAIVLAGTGEACRRADLEMWVNDTLAAERVPALATVYGNQARTAPPHAREIWSRCNEHAGHINALMDELPEHVAPFSRYIEPTPDAEMPYRLQTHISTTAAAVLTLEASAATAMQRNAYEAAFVDGALTAYASLAVQERGLASLIIRDPESGAEQPLRVAVVGGPIQEGGQ